MTDRDRLIELVCDKIQDGHCIGYCNHPPCNQCNNLADYLIENGVIVPPCKVGRTVWRVVKEYNGETRVVEGEVFEITVTHEYGQKFEYRFYFWAKGEEFIERNYSLWCGFEVFGKTVFLTKEEAEETLKGGEG